MIYTVDPAFTTTITGRFTGRCPLTGRFLSAVEEGDDEEVEYSFCSTTEDMESEEHTDDIDEDDLSWLTADDVWPNEREPEESGNWCYEEETVAAWVERNYRHRFPRLWGDELAAKSRSSAVDVYDGNEPPMPRQSGSSVLRESSGAVLHRPVGYDMTWMSHADLRCSIGRSHHSDKRAWWSGVAKQRRKTRTYDQPDATNHFALYSGNGLQELITADSEDDGHTVVSVLRFDDYYEHLLTVNTIDHELKNAWVRDWAEIETSAQIFWRNQATPGYRDEEAQLRLAHSDYYRGAYAKRPQYDRVWGRYTHQTDNKTAHGWQDYWVELEAAANAEILQAAYQFHLDMNDGYRYPHFDEGYSSASADAEYDMAAAKKRFEDDEYQKLADACTEDDFDEVAHERWLDSQIDGIPLSQYGGPRGWKAGTVANLRLAEFA